MNQVTTGQMPKFCSWQHKGKLLQLFDKLQKNISFPAKLFQRQLVWTKSLFLFFQKITDFVDEGNHVDVINLIFARHQKQEEINFVLHPCRKRYLISLEGQPLNSWDFLFKRLSDSSCSLAEIGETLQIPLSGCLCLKSDCPAGEESCEKYDRIYFRFIFSYNK